MSNPEHQLLVDLVKIPSVSGNEEKASEFLVSEMKKRGFDESYVDEAGNAVGIIGQGPKQIVLLGHIDTVPGDVPVRVEGSILYGRGSVDAKGPLCSYVSALARLVVDKKNWQDQWKVIVVGAVEEEVESSKGARYCIDKFSPEYFINGEPSSWDALTLGYKGRMLVAADMKGASQHGAAKSIGLLDRAVVFWARMREFAEFQNRGKKIFDQLDCELIDMSYKKDGLSNRVHMEMGFRLPLNFDVNGFKNHMNELVQNCYDRDEEGQILKESDVVLSFGIAEVAHRDKKSSPLVKALMKGIRLAGGTPRFKVKTGTSDMNVLAPHWKCPVVAYGPGDSHLDHTPNEHIDLNEYSKSIEVLEQALIELVGKK